MRRCLMFVLILTWFLSAAAAAEDKTDVPACDDLIHKYHDCIETKVAAKQQATFRASLQSMRKNWLQLSREPNGKDALKVMCPMTADTVKRSMARFGCAF